MKIVIQIIGFASDIPCSCAGEYLKSFDFEANNGTGQIGTTRNVSEAMNFGPNRPMTCATVAFKVLKE